MSVPAEKVDALREELRKKAHERNLNAVAWQLVDAVETEDDDWPFTKERPRHLWEGNFTPAPSPARDDAEKVIAELLAKHRGTKVEATRYGCRCECGESICPDLDGKSHDYHYREHIASVIAAHMAAPDELTALRERIKALADEWSREDAGLTLNLAANDLRMLLGDA